MINNNKMSGFTLLEMLVALFIISIVFAVGIMRFGSFASNHQLKEQAEEIQQIIKAQKLQALESGTPRRIIFDNKDYKIQSAWPAAVQKSKIITVHWNQIEKNVYHSLAADKVTVLNASNNIKISSRGQTHDYRILLIKHNKVIISLLSRGEIVNQDKDVST